MDCRTLDRLITRYFANTLPDRQARLVRQHLERCSACRGRLDDDQRLRLTLQDAALPPIAVDSDAIVTAAKKAGVHIIALRADKVKPHVFPLRAAAAVILLAVSGLLFLYQTVHSRPAYIARSSAAREKAHLSTMHIERIEVTRKVLPVYEGNMQDCSLLQENSF